MNLRLLAAIPTVLFTLDAASQGPAVSSLAPRVKTAMDSVQERGKRCPGTEAGKEAERLVSYGRSVHGTVSKDNNADPAIYQATTKYVERYEDEVRKFMDDAKSKCAP